MINLEITNSQTLLPLDEGRLQATARAVLAGEGIATGEISLVILDDPAIHELNRRHLQHDYPTDVLSFTLEASDSHREGEVIVSAETAARTAAENGWQPQQELALYVVHGMLHLAGYEDKTPAGDAAMREHEWAYLRQTGWNPPGDRELKFAASHERI